MLPLLLHAHFSQYQDDLGFWVNLADEHGDLILELGCGTGRILNHLAQFYHYLFGIDHSHEMLAFLKNNLTVNNRSKIHIYQADFSEFHLAEKFNLILVACNTFSTLPEHKRVAVLSRVKCHLTSGGVFAFSVPNPASISNLREQSQPEIEAVFKHPIDNEPVQVSSSWTRDGSKWTLTWQYDHLLPDGTIKRTNAQTTHYLTPVDQYTREIKNAGFQKSILYGDFDQSPYTEDSSYLISVSST